MTEDRKRTPATLWAVVILGLAHVVLFGMRLGLPDSAPHPPVGLALVWMLVAVLLGTLLMIQREQQQQQEPRLREDDQRAPPQLDTADLLDTILLCAIQWNATGIHMALRNGQAAVEYEIEGVQGQALLLPSEDHERLVRRVKLVTGLVLADPRVPQRGQLKRSAVFRGHLCEFTFLISSVPTPESGRIDMQLLELSWGPTSGEELRADGRTLHWPPPRTSSHTRILGDRVSVFRRRPRRRLAG